MSAPTPPPGHTGVPPSAVLERFGFALVQEINHIIRQSLATHPPGSTCDCPAIEALGVVLAAEKRREL